MPARFDTLTHETLTCTHINTRTSRFSFIGPNRRRKKLRMVRLVASRILPVVGCDVISVNPNVDNARRTTVVSFFGGLWNNALDGCKRFVSGSNLRSHITSVKKNYEASCDVNTLVPYVLDKARGRIVEDKIVRS